MHKITYASKTTEEKEESEEMMDNGKHVDYPKRFKFPEFGTDRDDKPILRDGACLVGGDTDSDISFAAKTKERSNEYEEFKNKKMSDIEKVAHMTGIFAKDIYKRRGGNAELKDKQGKTLFENVMDQNDEEIAKGMLDDLSQPQGQIGTIQAEPGFGFVGRIEPSKGLKPHKCPVCGGRGEVVAGWYDLHNEGPKEGVTDCHSCEKGVVWK